MAASPDPDRVAGRRAYDSVAPAITLAIEETVGTTRHLLRNEFTTALLGLSNKLDALNTTVTEGNVQSAREHAVVQQCIADVQADIAELKELTPRVIDLEKHDVGETARNETQEKILRRLEEGRRWMIGTCVAVIAVVLAAAGLLLDKL